MKKLQFILAAVIMLVSVSTAQVIKPGKIGLGLDGATSAPNLALKYFFSDKIATEVLVGFNLYAPGGDTPQGATKVTGTDFRIGLAGFYHFSDGEFSPYFGVEALYESNKSGGFYLVEPDAKNSIKANLVLGGEYFPAKQFSIGLKEKFGLDAELSRDIPKEENDLYLKTATELTVRYYFN
jgi:outer membrane protein W